MKTKVMLAGMLAVATLSVGHSVYAGNDIAAQSHGAFQSHVLLPPSQAQIQVRQNAAAVLLIRKRPTHHWVGSQSPALAKY
jgi:hypothetical protein